MDDRVDEEGVSVTGTPVVAEDGTLEADPVEELILDALAPEPVGPEPGAA